MKKLLSLFLSLFLVMTPLFAYQVDAAQPKDIESEHTHECFDETCAHDEVALLHTADAHATSFSSGTEAGIAATCTHTYKTVQYNAAKHKKVCTKCGYSCLTVHNFKYQNCGNNHLKYCSLCGYSVSAAHSYRAWQSYSSTLHKRTCICGGCTYAKHNLSYSSNGSTTHQIRCSACPYSSSEYCVFECVPSTSLSDPYHQWRCWRCKSSHCERHVYTLTPVEQTSSYHVFKCAVCGSNWAESHIWGPAKEEGEIVHCTRCMLPKPF